MLSPLLPFSLLSPSPRLSLPASHNFSYAEHVAIKLCPRCRKPYLAAKESCPHCPEPYTWNQESYANVGCLLAMLLPLVFLIMFWIFMFLGPFLR